MFPSSGLSGPPLRRALGRALHFSVFEHPAAQIFADQFQDSLVLHFQGDHPHQDVMVDVIEECLDVDVHRPSPRRQIR